MRTFAFALIVGRDLQNDAVSLPETIDNPFNISVLVNDESGQPAAASTALTIYPRIVSVILVQAYGDCDLLAAPSARTTDLIVADEATHNICVLSRLAMKFRALVMLALKVSIWEQMQTSSQ